MKHLIVPIIILFSLQAYSQTREIEVKNITRRFENKEFDMDEYQSMAKVWKGILDLYDGYPEFPLNSQGDIEFEFIHEYPFQSKKVIFDRIHEWASITFGSLKSVLHYENFENGKIVLKGTFDIRVRTDSRVYGFFGFTGELEQVIRSITCNSTYIFTIKDNKLKLQIVNIGYDNGLYKAPIKSFYPITDAPKEEWKKQLDALYQTNIELTLTAFNLNAYIKTVGADYDF